MDRRHFGPFATNFEHHGPPISRHGTIRGIEHDMAGDLCCDARGIRWGLRDRRGHAARSKPQPVRSLRGGIILLQSGAGLVEVID